MKKRVRFTISIALVAAVVLLYRVARFVIDPSVNEDQPVSFVWQTVR